MDRRLPLALIAASTLAALALAGCTGSKPYDPLEYEETGRTVHLKIRVVDLYEETLYPGLNANLWAFCVEPNDPNDMDAVSAIHYWDRIPGDPGTGTTSWGSAKLSPEDAKVCSVPAPTIEVNQGDRVIVEFSHSHIHPHTIHWHGQFVPTDMDGAPGLSQTAVESGGRFTYDFIAKRAGTLWYHCHVDTQMHQMQGLFGMFIVRPQDERFEPDVDTEATMVLSTAVRSIVEAVPGQPPHGHQVGFVSGNLDNQNPPQFMDEDVFMINGHSYPLTHKQNQTMFHIGEGERMRMRILNAGSTVEAIHPHGHDMLVTHRDGVPLASPYWVDTLSIGPAERYDVVIEGNNPGAWMIHTHVNDHETNDRQSPGGMHTMLVYHGYEDQCAECRAELPGGFGYEKPVFMPADFENATVLSLNPNAAGAPGGNVNAHATWKFPVELPCAVIDVRLDGFLTSGTLLGSALTSLEVQLLDPDGAKKGNFTLGRDSPSGEFTLKGFTPGSDIHQTMKGNYTVDVAGAAVQADVHLKVKVDYYVSFEEMKRLHQLDKFSYPTKCGKYGNGTEGLPQGPAPG